MRFFRSRLKFGMLSGSQFLCVVASCTPTAVVVGPLPRCVHISLFHRCSLLHFVSLLHPQSPQSSPCNHCRTHSLSLPSPKPRTPLQSESYYNDFLSCPLTFPVPSGSCVRDIATRERMGTSFLRYAPSRLLSQSCVFIWDYFALLSR